MLYLLGDGTFFAANNSINHKTLFYENLKSKSKKPSLHQWCIFSYTKLGNYGHFWLLHY